MHRIQEHLAFAKAHGLFKSASAHEVISSLLPEIFRKQRSENTNSGTSLDVNFFISHSWACNDFLKLLAICHHLKNCNLAFASSVIASLFAVVILVLYAGSFTNVAQMDNNLVCICTMFCPLGIFVCLYFFGHTAWGEKSFWFDRVCVPQNDALAKVQTLRTIPVSPADIQEIRHMTSYPTKDEIMDAFNAYVRGPLRDTVLKSAGKEEYVSFTLCCIASLPFFLTGLALTFLCDGQRDCQKSASLWGYPSLVSYMLGNSVSNLLVVPLFNAAICPLMLRATCLINRAVPDEESTFLRMLWGSLLCAGLLFLWESLLAVECGLVVVALAKSSWLCFAGSTAGLLLLLWVHWILFRADGAISAAAGII
eukprot:Skav203362  [mRNA]  locus=scaffold18:109468:115283:- [translate_table: standard]